MIGWVRNLIIIGLVLTLIYALLSFTARMKQKNLLEAEYKTQTGVRQQVKKNDVFIARGMKKYARSYKPKLIVGVYLIPGAILCGLIWLAQYS